MNKETFKETYGLDPIKMIDLKALMGDSSDNIPGVKGIGEKTAIKLLQEYDNLDNLYNNLDNLSNSVKTKLSTDKDNAYMSKELATINKSVPMEINLDDITYSGNHTDELIEIYNDLEFYSFLKKMDNTKKEEVKKEEINYKVITDLNELDNIKDSSLYIELNNDNYHNADIIGISIYDGTNGYYIPSNLIDNCKYFNDSIKYTYDLKRLYVSLKKRNIIIDNVNFDTMICVYLLNYNVKNNIEELMNKMNYEISFIDKNTSVSEEEFIKRSILKAKFIYDTKEELTKELEEDNLTNLYNDIEHPLSIILGDMEYEGIRVDKNVLNEMKEEIKIKIELISKDIYNYAGEEFNISSVKQLGYILFDKLKLPVVKKTKTGYSTDNSVLEKLKNGYPIVEKILEYRLLTKLYSTYIEGLLNVVGSDNKIHTIYTQTLTRTGRLSSIEPNLQNIPVRNEYGKLIRKAFVPENDSIIMSSDYSQIELRIFAHLANVKDMIEAFNNHVDIHTKTAMDIFNVPMEGVTSLMRRQAKAVNFGILYGISSFGLSEDLKISVKEAKAFINKYFETYPGIKDYMNNIINKAHKDGYVLTVMNRKRIIDELNNNNRIIKAMGERMALNTGVQGSAADILKKAMIEIDKEFKKNNIKSKMLLQVHDELIFNCLNEEKETVLKIVTEIMENTYKLSVPLEVDVNFGSNWYEAK